MIEPERNEALLRAAHARFKRISRRDPHFREWLLALDPEEAIWRADQERWVLLRVMVDSAVGAAIAASWKPSDEAASAALRARYEGLEG